MVSRENFCTKHVFFHVRSADDLGKMVGSQMTQGVLLPQQGYIVELLPWIPSYAHGKWAAITDGPTCVGVIWDNTDINHLGYKLGRDSVPLCLETMNTTNQELDRACLTNITSGTEKKFYWADRDFNVPLHIIEEFISAFLLRKNDNTCGQMSNKALDTNFVFYNAFCRPNVNETRFVPRHYYREFD